jgi:stage V sporulation protein AF
MNKGTVWYTQKIFYPREKKDQGFLSMNHKSSISSHTNTNQYGEECIVAQDQEMQVPLHKEFSRNIDYLLREMRVEINFDVVHRELECGGRKMGMFYIDGYAGDDSAIEVLKRLYDVSANDLRRNPVETLVRQVIPHQEVETTDDLEEVISQVLGGQAAFLVEGADQAILVDLREYPSRSPEEPDIERVVRGPRDGFVETIVFNCALIRRRVRDRSLVMEHLKIGRRSKTDIIVSYVDSIVDPELVKRLKKKIENIEVDGLPMGEKTLEEYIFGKNMNPYPLVRYTERGDTCAVHLLEGHVIIIVDGTPSVMICPATFWHHMQHAEEYRQKPVVGAFLRWVRFVAVAASLFLLPLWYMLAVNPDILPERWKFIGVEEVGQVSLIWQFFLSEIGVEMLRMAAIHTPNALATALGLVAAVLIGEIAVEVGLFTEEVILYLAIAVVGNYATPSYELALANRIFRIVFLLSGAWFGWYGLGLALVLWFLLLTCTKTLNTPYLWPFLPFNGKAMYEVLVRTPMPLHHKRPEVLNVQDETRGD